MRNIEIIDGKKQVRESIGSRYYQLSYDWPMDTVFTINDDRLDTSMEVYTNYPENAATYMGMQASTIQECEDILWTRYQRYISCKHEFTRDHPKKGHYSNGAGFCKHCGMFKSQAFEPETICETCGKHANLLSCIDGKQVCEDCYEGLSWHERTNCNYMSKADFLEYCKRMLIQVQSFHQDIMDDGMHVICEYVRHDGERCKAEWRMKKVEEGVYEVKEYSGTGIYLISNLLFGPKSDGTYYFLDSHLFLLARKKDTIHQLLSNDNTMEDVSLRNMLFKEVEKIERTLERNKYDVEESEVKHGRIED